MQTQYPGIGYRIDLYFHEYKLVIEVDESLERELDYAFIRINPDEKDFNIFKEVNKIYRHITQSKEENKTKEQENKIKQQKSKFANELLT